MKMLLTGGSGQVGSALKEALAPLGQVLAPRRNGMDLAKPDSIVRVVRSFKPELVINAGAFTAVDLAESQPGVAAIVNATAPAILAEEARRLGAGIVQFSTDYVFDGAKPSPYVETDAPAPLNVYGRTKLEGERAVIASGARYLILRTSWVYAARGRNFLNTILRLAAERPELRVVDDQRGSPTSANAIAAGVATLLSLPWEGGLYHVTCSGETTWHGFAAAILKHRPPTRAASLIPIATRDHPTPARRPANSVLDNGKLSRAFGVRLPSWEDALDAVLGRAPGAVNDP
jgi:dTDP-4-dehydrorhamnose reductase